MNFRKKKYDAHRFKTAVVAVGVYIFTAVWCPAALAHKVTVFAWVEGDTVYTESKFSGGRKAREATVTVYDDQGKRLLEGKTDAQGKFAFKVPKKSTLKIVLQAGMGHQNSWVIPREEVEAALAAAESPSLTETVTLPVVPKAPASEKGRLGKQDMDIAHNSASPLSAGDIQAAVEKAVNRQLKPVIAKLNRLEAQNDEPRLTDILGGIGYILGLVGLAAYIKYRKKGT